ncbi:hypothetical protein LTSEBAI_4532, partial [Salmonella enterica subsp. enterica serovar Baildon str. R6-199]
MYNFFRQRVVVDSPAISPLQGGVPRRGFSMFHHLLGGLSAAPGA